MNGRTDSPHDGLRYYRFSGLTEQRKAQRLMPGLVVVLQGRKTARLGSRTLSYAEGSQLVLGTETLCHGTVVEASPERPYLAIHLDLPPESLARACNALARTELALRDCESGEPSGDTYVRAVDVAILAALERLLGAIHDPLDRETIAPLIIDEIIVRLLRSSAAGAVRAAAGIDGTAAAVQRSMQFIGGQFARPLSVPKLARQVGMSPSHYAHRFREVAGVSPMRFLRETRLERARALLLSTGLSVAEIALRVGFASASHFSREFKRRYGEAPGDHGQRLRVGRVAQK